MSATLTAPFVTATVFIVLLIGGIFAVDFIALVVRERLAPPLAPPSRDDQDFGIWNAVTCRSALGNRNRVQTHAHAARRLPPATMPRSRLERRARFPGDSSMAKTSVATQLANLDQRLVRVEQILPTLATKEDLNQAIAPLATKEDLKAYATKPDLLEVRDELRRHMDVKTEAMRGDIRLLAEYVEHLATKTSDR